MNPEHQEKINQTQKNLFYLSIGVILIALIFMARFAQLSLFKTVNQVDLATYHQARPERSSIIEAKRGSLFDRQGQPIAMDTTSYSLFAVLGGEWSEGNVVQDKDQTARVLAKYLEMDQGAIYSLLNQTGVDQVEFGPAGQNLSPRTKEAIEAEHLAGIHFNSKTSRTYINDFFASHLIGYVKDLPRDLLNQPHFIGEMGIEAAFDPLLSGQSDGEEPAIGQDLYLTLDTRLQNSLEDSLDQVYARYQPKSTAAYLVEAKTGRLLAAGQRPTFNLNSRQGIEDLWQNLLVENAYEPGSTIKVLTMAAAYDHHVFYPGETFMSGKVEVYDQTVREYNRFGWGEISFEEGFARSSNVGMVELVNRMGNQTWAQQLEQLGFGQTTASLLPNESAGTMDFSNPVSRTMSGFGQAISATPLQLMQAFTSVANDGMMKKIQYIDHVGQKENDGYQVQDLGQMFTPEACRAVRQLMVDSVNKPYGTATPFKSDETQVAAKTGTAEIANPDGPGYLQGEKNFLYSVVSYFPAEDPEYLLYIFVKQPQQLNGKIGTQIVAEVFHPIVKSVMINQ